MNQLIRATSLALLVLFSSLANAADTIELALPDQPMPIRTTVTIGDLRNPLAIDGTLSLTLRVDDEVVRLGMTYRAANLYAALLDSLRSRAKSGCSVVGRSGSGRGAVEAKLCRVRSIRLELDRAKQRLWLKADARFRFQVNGIASDTSWNEISAEYGARFVGSRLVLTPVSLNIEGVPGEFDERIVEDLSPINVALDECLTEATIRLEEASLPENSTSVTLRAAANSQDALRMAFCLAQRASR